MDMQEADPHAGGAEQVTADAPDVAVALDALESDAVRWTDAATQLRAAAVAAGGQVLPAAAFSFAGAEVAVVYEALRSRTATLLAEGAANLDAVAAALRAVEASYVAQEDAAAQRLGTVSGDAGHGPR